MLYKKFTEEVRVTCAELESQRNRRDILDLLKRALELEFHHAVPGHLEPVYQRMVAREKECFKCVGLKWGEWHKGEMTITISFFRWFFQRPRKS